MNSSPSGNRLASLDGLRAIAIALVLGGHSADAYVKGHPLWLEPLRNSSFGVRLFFVLSGFLITKLLAKELGTYGRISLKAFYIRRSLRIFPAFYLYIAVVVALSALGFIAISRQQVIGAVTYSWNYLQVWHDTGPKQGSWFFGHLWTLSLEEQFYLFWPGLLILIGWRRAKIFSLVAPLLVPILRLFWYWRFPDHRGLLGMMFHTAIDSILIGCAFAMWEERIPIFFKRSGAVLVGALIFTFLVSPLVAGLFRPYRISVGFGLDALGAGLLILQAVRGGAWQRALSWKPLALVGTWSYSIYLWQQLFLTPYNTTWSGKLPWCLPCLLACALVSFYAIERPILRLKRRFERAHLTPSSATVPPP